MSSSCSSPEASGGGGGGWLSTKKRGRDDDQILRDRKRALDARRKQPPSKRTKITTKQQQQPATKPKKHIQNKLDKWLIDDDDDDDEELTEGSDNDDDELVFDSDDDEQVTGAKSSCHRKTRGGGGTTLSFEPSKRNRPPPSSTKYDDDNGSSSEEDDDAWNSSLTKRTSRPAPFLQKKFFPSSAITTKTRGGGESTLPVKNGKKENKRVLKKKDHNSLRGDVSASTKNNKPQDTYHDLLLMTSDEEEVTTPPVPKKANNGFSAAATTTTSRFFPPKPRVSTTSSDSLDSHNKTSSSFSSSEQQRAQPGTTTSSSEVDDDEDDFIGKSMQTKPRLKQKKCIGYEGNDKTSIASKLKPTKNNRQLRINESDEESFAGLGNKPIVDKTKKTAKKKKKKKLVVREDDDDEVMTPVMNRSKQLSTSYNLDNDSSMDEDEAVALAWAIEASQKESAGGYIQKLEQSPTVIVVDDDVNKAITKTKPKVVLVDEQQQQQQHEDDDEALSEDAVVANVVLATANSLSSQVLQAMLRWSMNGTGDDVKSKDGPVPQGLLVDGALAVHSTMGRNSPDPSWISQDLMQRICPLVQLKDYQLIGVNWLALLHRMKCEIKGKTYTHVNGILADEMGLGKTVQTIAFLAWLKFTEGNKKSFEMGRPMCNDDSSVNRDRHVVSLVDSDDDDEPTTTRNNNDCFRPHIIVAPNSVVSNWKREFERFCPEMKVIMYHGSMEDRKNIRAELRHLLFGQSRKGYEAPDVLLTTNAYFSNEVADDRTFFRKINFNYMIVDEGHSLKNPASKRYKSMDMMRTNHRLLLTGTPVQNAPKELMALLCFLMPLFSGRGSNEDYFPNDGGKSMLQHFVQLQKEGESDDKEAYGKLKQLFAPFVLRRKKQDVLSQILPEKERRVEVLALDAASLALYNSILASQCKKARTVDKTDDHSTRWSLFADLRKSVNHPLLLRSRHNKPDEIHHLAKSFLMYGFFSGEGCTLDKVKKQLESYNDLDIHLAALELIEENPRREAELSRYVLEEDDLFSSAKFVRLRQLLPELISDGHRVLIFSQWTRVLDLLGILLENLGMQFLRLDGSVTTSTRQELIDRFNEDISINAFLLSTRAGGLGINLTTADTCIIHDLDFNPFNDLQAEDRCHRIGQKKKVTVIKMVAKDTVDEYIYNMQQRKELMNAAIMEKPDSAEWFQKAQVSDMECIIQTALDQFRSSNSGKKHAAVAAAPAISTPKEDVPDERLPGDSDPLSKPAPGAIGSHEERRELAVATKAISIPSTQINAVTEDVDATPSDLSI